MSSDSVYESVFQLLVEGQGVESETITPEASLRDDLGLDSLAIVELQMQAEEAFGVEISDEAAAAAATVADVVRLVRQAGHGEASDGREGAARSS